VVVGPAPSGTGACPAAVVRRSVKTPLASFDEGSAGEEPRHDGRRDTEGAGGTDHEQLIADERRPDRRADRGDRGEGVRGRD